MKRGRKKSNLSEIVFSRLLPDEKKALESLSRIRGRTMASLIREAVQERLENEQDLNFEVKEPEVDKRESITVAIPLKGKLLDVAQEMAKRYGYTSVAAFVRHWIELNLELMPDFMRFFYELEEQSEHQKARKEMVKLEKRYSKKLEDMVQASEG